MEAILLKISWALLVAAGAFLVWAVKGLVKIVFDNRDQIKESYFRDLSQQKELCNLDTKVNINHTKLEEHGDRIVKAEQNISTIALCHNASNPDNTVIIELK